MERCFNSFTYHKTSCNVDGQILKGMTLESNKHIHKTETAEVFKFPRPDWLVSLSYASPVIFSKVLIGYGSGHNKGPI